MRKRTHARELALQALYQHDVRRRVESAAATSTEEALSFLESAAADPEVKEYARWLVDGALSVLPELDQRIATVARNWKLSRITPIDRSILRLALFEMLESEEVPPKVAINEAINLAKRYSTEQSGAFVNGILDRFYGEIRGREGDHAEKLVREEGGERQGGEA
jgi:transcription antitermination factor NusB